MESRSKRKTDSTDKIEQIDKRRKVKEVHESLPSPLLIIDIITTIFKLLPQESWCSAMLTCKKWNEVGRRLFDPSKMPNLRSIMCRLIEKNKLITIKYLLNERSVNPCIGNGIILAHAARYATLETMRELLRHSHNRNIGRDGDIMRNAVEYNRAELIKEMIPTKSGFGSFQWAPLHLIPSELTRMLERAAKLGYLATCREVLKHPLLHDLGTSLIKAANNKHIEVVKLLLNDHRTEPAIGNSVVLLKMVQYEEVELVEKLLDDWRIEPEAADDFAIWCAAKNCNLVIAEKLVHFADVNPFGNDYSQSALYQAVYNDDADMVRLFMRHCGHDFKYLGDNTAFLHAVEESSINVVKLLIEKGADPSVDHNQALVTAAGNGDIEIVQLLMQDKRVDPSDQDNHAIVAASMCGHIEVVKMLLQDKRVDPSAQDNQAIIDATQNGEIETVKLLMQDERVDPSAQNNQALMVTLDIPQDDLCRDMILELLKDKRVDVSARNNQFFRKAMENNKMSVVTKFMTDAAANILDKIMT